MGGKVVEYRVEDYPNHVTPEYVSMFEEWFSVREGLVILHLDRGGSDPFKPLREGDPEVDAEEYLALLRRLRIALANAIYSDAIYITVAEGDLWGFPIDLLLASDYVGGEALLASRGYSHLLSGFTYGMFRGGHALLNLLYKGVTIDRLVGMGLLASIDSAEAYEKYDSLLLRKRVLREVFLRDYHHLLEIEETIVRRYFSLI